MDKALERELIQKGRDFLKSRDTEELEEQGREDYQTDQELKKPQPPLVKAPMGGAVTQLPRDFKPLALQDDFLAVVEVNSSMGLIVAAPTAGSSGVVPGVLLALKEENGLCDEALLPALYNASAIGYLAMRNATVAGAVGGCQAEVGVASAMAASAAAELMGGTPDQCLDAASTALMNLLGLVCDPVGGLVEYPCQNRNAVGVANALTAAEISLSGVKQLIPFDEMLSVMYSVGRRLAPELRETALGGCAVAPSACAAAGRCHGCS